MPEQNIIRIVTHSGTFHVDDMFAVATLQLLHGVEHTEIVRSREKSVWESGDYVLDVGGVYDPKTKRYDHHQHGGAGARDNGVPYSSFGLVWKHHGMELTQDEEVWSTIDTELVIPVDMADCGIDVYTPTNPGIHPILIHRMLVQMRPTWKEGVIHDERFMELLPFARRMMEREIITAVDRKEGRHFVEEAYAEASDKRLVVLSGGYPWSEVLSTKPEPLFVVKPKSAGSHWEVECVRSDVHTFTNRKSLPLEWRGYAGEELVARTGVPGSVFCHNGGFIAVTENKESALRLAKLALDA
jgi:uncharacterized UPF0160 family protein